MLFGAECLHIYSNVIIYFLFLMVQNFGGCNCDKRLYEWKLPDRRKWSCWVSRACMLRSLSNRGTNTGSHLAVMFPQSSWKMPGEVGKCVCIYKHPEASVMWKEQPVWSQFSKLGFWIRYSIDFHTFFTFSPSKTSTSAQTKATRKLPWTG